jgi:hypothetical protein
VIFLDPGLAEALCATDLPADLSVNDIGFPWPSIRLMAPKGLFLSADGRSGEVQYVDVAFAGQNEVLNLSEELAGDLENGLAKFGGKRPLDARLTKGFIHPQAGQFYACALSYRQSGGDSVASYQTAAWSVQWETRLLQEVIQTGDKADLDHGKDSEFPNLERIRLLVLNTLIVLSNYRSSVLLEEPPVVRALKLEGPDVKAELARGRFLSELLRPRTIRTGKTLEQQSWAEIGQTTITAVRTPARARAKSFLFVRGHHRRVRFGKGLRQSRLAWIAPYNLWTGGRGQERLAKDISATICSPPCPVAHCSLPIANWPALEPEPIGQPSIVQLLGLFVRPAHLAHLDTDLFQARHPGWVLTTAFAYTGLLCSIAVLCTIAFHCTMRPPASQTEYVVVSLWCLRKQ